jgi:RNA polymerase sigma-19 factor, ECF subfamily
MPGPKLIKTLFVAHASQVYGFFRRHLPERSDAEDLSQQVFLRLLLLKDPSSIKDPHNYLLTVANNLRKEQFYTGRSQRIANTSLEEIDAAELPQLTVEFAADVEIDQQTRVRRLREALLKLPQADQMLLAMHFRDGLSFSEIARRRGKTKTGIQQALLRAIRRCGKQMDELGGGPRS